MTDRIGGIVLCGGQSSRMGQPKEWLSIGGNYALPHVVRLLAPACQPVVVAARHDQVLPPLPKDVAVVCDEFEDSGPLAGLLAGLEFLAKSTDAAFVVPCDHLHIRPAFIQRLIAKLGTSTGVVVKHQEKLYALTGIYRVGLAPMLRQMLGRGERAAWQFVLNAGARTVDACEFDDVDPERESLRNVNHPGDR